MAARLPRRPTATTLSATCTHTHITPTLTANPASRTAAFSTTPTRHATIIRRPRRPYTFTQLVQLSDGSTYTQRTTSPLGLYKSTKDTRNHVVWQPNEKSLRNVEVDEAGKLAAFRGRFGRGWDAESKSEGEGEGEGEEDGNKEARGAEGGEGKSGDGEGSGSGIGGSGLSDLISGYSRPEDVIKDKVPFKKQKK